MGKSNDNNTSLWEGNQLSLMKPDNRLYRRLIKLYRMGKIGEGTVSPVEGKLDLIKVFSANLFFGL